MNFAERVTVENDPRSDDGKEHGIRPRWAEVYA